MGNVQSSRNYLSNLTETITRIIQENAQTCQVNATQIQELVAQGDCKITLKNVDFNQLASVDFSCMQQADLNAKVASEMQIQLDQLAKSLVSGLDFHIFNHQDTQNFIDNHVRLVTEIVNRLQQSCTVSAGQYQGFRCGNGGEILVTDSSFGQVIRSIFDCAQQGETVADVKTDIKEYIKQAAISENKGLSFDLLFIAMIVIVVVVVIVVLNKGLDWKFLAIGLPVLGIIIFIIYLLIANKKNWWPFKSRFDEKKQPTPPPPAPRMALEPTEAQKQVEERDAMARSNQAWGRAELNISACQLGNRSLTPLEYRALQYGDGQIAFEKPFDQRSCLAEVKPVRAALPSTLRPPPPGTIRIIAMKE